MQNLTRADIIKKLKQLKERVASSYPDDSILNELLENLESAICGQDDLPGNLLSKNDNELQAYKESFSFFNQNAPVADEIEGVFTGLITERLESLEMIKQSEERFRKIYENFPVGMAIIDNRFRIVKANPAYCRILGYEEVELQQMTFRDITHPEDKEKDIDLVKKLINGDLHILKTEKRYIRKDDQIILGSLTVVANFDNAGNFVYNIAMLEDITERTQTVRALMTSEERLRQVTDQSKTVIWEVDHLGVYTFVSPLSANVWGYTPEELVGKLHYYDIHPADGRESFKEATLEVFRQKQYFTDLPNPILHANGQVVWMATNGIPLVDETGNLTGYRGADIDITDRKIAEEKIREQNERLQAIIHAIPDLIFILDRQGIFRDVYVTDVESLVIPKDLILGKNIKDIFDNYLTKQLQEKINTCLGTMSLVTHEYALTINGPKFFETRMVPVENNQVLAFVRDITDKKLSEIEIQKLSKAVEQSPVAIIITDPLAKTEYVNAAFHEISGYTSDEIIGNNLRILQPRLTNNETYRNLWQNVSEGNVWSGEIIIRIKSGELLWIRMTVNPVKNSEGSVTQFLIIAEDINRQKLDEERILDLNAALEIEIKEAKRAKEKAEESDQLKSSFLANMSHEIRTPLNAILGFTRIVTSEDDILPEQKEEYLSIIDNSADNLLRIINDVLEISKLETRQLRLEKKVFDVASVLNELFILCRKQLDDAGKKHIEVRNIHPESKIVINTDETRFFQVFTNLLNNAIKFTEQGSVSFGITEVTSAKIRFFVSDTGIGIKKEFHGIIFERFRQAETTLSRSYGGTGLGLSIVKSLVEIMGGNITVDSETGKGTTFTFDLPTGIY